MKKQKTKQDTFADREALKYENPIASREYILEILADIGKPLTLSQLATTLAIVSDQDLIALRRRLRAMERDGQIIRNRRNGYGIVGKMDLVKGYVIAHPDGFGFLIPEDGGGDLFLSARQMRQLIHRDRVVARVSGIDSKGRREGTVIDVLERNTQRIVGRFIQNNNVGFVAPDNKRITHDIVVPAENQGGAKDGQIVVVELIEQPSIRRQPIGAVVEILGEHMGPGMEIDVAIRVHELPHLWPEGVEREIAVFSEQIPHTAPSQRTDLRHLPLVTIDGKDAKDFDDAVYCEREGRYWRLIVAIADVAHYVKPGSALDREAQERGNSVYFPGRVIPMLPEILSNGLCSIKPEQDRLCMCCDMLITSTGIVKKYTFYNGVMRSHARLIYEDVAQLLDGDKALCDKYKDLLPHLQNLNELFQALQIQRKKRGAIDFETVESVIEFGENKKIEKIVPLVRNQAHRIIEECMIAANVCAAQYITTHEINALFRVHDVPDKTKLADLANFLKDLGLKMNYKGIPQAKHYALFLDSIRDRVDSHLIQTVLLRSLSQATYTPLNIGHFGLSLEMYTHFTSPIRRYPDLIVHRAIKKIIGDKGQWYSEDEMRLIGERCSMTERRADDATRDVVDWLKCEYMLDKVGMVYQGIISGVTSFGLFVELQEIYVEGLVHVTSLSNDYYHFDPIKHCLIGEKTHKNYRLGDPIFVQVARVSLDTKRIDFELTKADLEQSGTRKSRKGKSRKFAVDATAKSSKKSKSKKSKSTKNLDATKSVSKKKKSKPNQNQGKKASVLGKKNNTNRTKK